MATLPIQIQKVLFTFAHMFSSPVWNHAQILILGAILARGKRTVTSALRTMGLSGETHFTNYHRVLNRAVWHACFGSKVLLGLLIPLLPAGLPIALLVDETIERRKGEKIKNKGVFRDSVRSTRKKAVRCYGLRWVSMMLVVYLPWSSRPWALPFYTVCAPSKNTCKKQGKRHKSIIDRVCFAMRLIVRWFPSRSWVIIGDGAYAAVDLILFALSLPSPVTLVARFRWNAALYDFPPAPVPGKRGRKPVKGKRQPTLKERISDPSTAWETTTVRWYQGQIKEVLTISGISLWYTPGKPPVCIRWVVVRDPSGECEDTPILCTDLQATTQQIIEWFVLRWNIEVTFQELRAHLGVETQRQWSDRAIGRTTPCLFGLFSIITLMASRLLEQKDLPIAQTAWYHKEQATFSDVIAFVRRSLWAERYFFDSFSETNLTKFPTELVDELLSQLSEAV